MYHVRVPTRSHCHWTGCKPQKTENRLLLLTLLLYPSFFLVSAFVLVSPSIAVDRCANYFFSLMVEVTKFLKSYQGQHIGRRVAYTLRFLCMQNSKSCLSKHKTQRTKKNCFTVQFCTICFKSISTGCVCG